MDWHLSQIGQKGKPDSYLAIGLGIDGILVGSVVYSRLRKPDIEMHIHTVDKRWCNKRVLRAIFDYPFNQLGCGRITVISDPAVPAVINFLQRIGFVHEGTLRQCSPWNTDLWLLGMLRGECKWVE